MKIVDFKLVPFVSRFTQTKKGFYGERISSLLSRIKSSFSKRMRKSFTLSALA